jgi:outer membrane murein-binding lipoprotein Lpp
MTGRTGAAVAIIVLMMQGSVLLGGESPDARIQELTSKIQGLDERVKQLEELVLPMKGEIQARTRSAGLRKRFEARVEKDRTAYSQAELKEIESLYQIANRQWNSADAQASLKKLTDTYAKANRTGCALLYLGQMTTGAEKENYLKKAIADFGDCFYGDGAQVGAYARFHLATYYREHGKNVEATALFTEIRKDYPDAIDHQGNLLVDMMPK